MMPQQRARPPALADLPEPGAPPAAIDASPLLLDELLLPEPYALSPAEKAPLFLKGIRQLCAHHQRHCPPYRRLLAGFGYHPEAIQTLADVPFLPVSLFKDLELRSIPAAEVFKTMTSSGTSGDKVSRIFLDRGNAAAQTRVLARLMGEVIGKKRLPMLVVDAETTVRNRALFSARGAAILGFSMFGRDVRYALDEDMRLDLPGISGFLERYQQQPFLVFGFTALVWQHLCLQLRARGCTLPMDNAILIHGGGWKKLTDQSVDAGTFARGLYEQAAIRQVINYYGMVEQTGSIFFACRAGHLHTSNFSEIIVRRPDDFSLCAPGESGIVQLLSLLPTSYPGHSILSEDIGRLIGKDACPCGRRGTFFQVDGRVRNTPMRGCSDVRADL